ncbi:MAG: hypothetical protein ACK58N_10095, partial [Synechocystis sp.]
MNTLSRSLKSEVKSPAKRDQFNLKSSSSPLANARGWQKKENDDLNQESSLNHTLLNSQAICACPSCTTLLDLDRQTATTSSN